jgi:KipI family sensor histidine kinase inhibitor
MKNDFRMRPVGVSAYLVEAPAAELVPSLHRHLAAGRRSGDLPGVVDLVPGAQTVLIDAKPGELDPAALMRFLSAWADDGAAAETPARAVELPVSYDGPDLAEVAQLTGLSAEAVVALHTGTEMTVAFCGFAPGFAYIGGLPEILRLPRLAVPRPAVPAGAVAIAEAYTGIYPRPSPGGWRILGRTPVELWNIDWETPALLTPGTRVRFTAAPGTSP